MSNNKNKEENKDNATNSNSNSQKQNDEELIKNQELAELRELQFLTNSEKFKEKLVPFIGRMNPMYNRVFLLYCKYLPVKTIDDEKLHSFLREILVIRKAALNSNNLIIINMVFFGMLFVARKRLDFKHLVGIMLGVYGVSYSLFTSLSYKYAKMLDPILKDQIKYTIMRLESGENYYEENRKEKERLKNELEKKDSEKLSLNHDEYIDNMKNKIALIEFYSKFMYGPVDEELENKIYFAVDTNNENYSRKDIFNKLDDIIEKYKQEEISKKIDIKDIEEKLISKGLGLKLIK